MLCRWDVSPLPLRCYHRATDADRYRKRGRLPDDAALRRISVRRGGCVVFAQGAIGSSHGMPEIPGVSRRWRRVLSTSCPACSRQLLPRRCHRRSPYRAIRSGSLGSRRPKAIKSHLSISAASDLTGAMVRIAGGFTR